MIILPEDLYLVPESVSSPVDSMKYYKNRLSRSELITFEQATDSSPDLDYLSLYDMQCTQITDAGDAIYSRIGYFAYQRLPGSSEEYDEYTGLVYVQSDSAYRYLEADICLDDDGKVMFSIEDRLDYYGYIMLGNVSKVIDQNERLIHSPAVNFLLNH